MLFPYLGTEVDMKLRLSEMFPGNGGICRANQQAARYDRLGETRLLVFILNRGDLQRTAQISLYHSHGSVVLDTFGFLVHIFPRYFSFSVIPHSISTMLPEEINASIAKAKPAKSFMRILL